MRSRHERSVSVLLVMLGIGLAFSSRVELDTVSNETVEAPVPQFDFSLKGVLCGDVNFGPLQGVLANYPKTVKTIREKALALANENNCRLCDVSVTHAAMKNPTVSCAASKSFLGSGNTNEGCLSGNGATGWRSNQVCLPCPDECGYCEKPGASDMTYLKSKWFKCVFQSETNNEALPPPWDCEEVKDRRKHRGQSAWCKYRKDLLSTSTNGLVLEDGSASWSLKITAAHCSGIAGIDDLEGPIQGVMKTVAPALREQYGRNCELCRITAGGPISSEGVGEFKFATKSYMPWAHAKCAYDDLGMAACRSDRGPVGWDKNRECAPCPFECATCKTEGKIFGTSNTFSCKLRPTARADYQLARLLSSSETSDEDSPPKLPQGFDCGKPEPRRCTAGSGLCMGFKVKCKFQVHVD